MYQPLAPCPGCARHVRVADRSCPFCGTSFASALIPQPGVDARRRLSRAALVTFAATLGAAGCGATVTNTDAGGTLDVGAAVDRPVAVDNGARDAGTPDTGFVTRDSGAPDDHGGPVAAYGGPFPTDAGPPDDEGNSSADYGSPPPRDAGNGPDDDGGSAAEYGAPPGDSGFFPLYGSPPRPDDAGL